MKLPQMPKISQSTSSKLPLHKRNKPNTTNTVSSKQTHKSVSEKTLPSVKTSIKTTNLSTKKKKYLPAKEERKKENSVQENSPVLNLHPTDSSESEDSMSTNSDVGNLDIFNQKKKHYYE